MSTPPSPAHQRLLRLAQARLSEARCSDPEQSTLADALLSNMRLQTSLEHTIGLVLEAWPDESTWPDE